MNNRLAKDGVSKALPAGVPAESRAGTILIFQHRLVFTESFPFPENGPISGCSRPRSLEEAEAGLTEPAGLDRQARPAPAARGCAGRSARHLLGFKPGPEALRRGRGYRKQTPAVTALRQQ